MVVKSGLGWFGGGLGCFGGGGVKVGLVVV